MCEGCTREQAGQSNTDFQLHGRYSRRAVMEIVTPYGCPGLSKQHQNAVPLTAPCIPIDRQRLAGRIVHLCPTNTSHVESCPGNRAARVAHTWTAPLDRDRHARPLLLRRLLLAAYTASAATAAAIRAAHLHAPGGAAQGHALCG